MAKRKTTAGFADKGVGNGMARHTIIGNLGVVERVPVVAVGASAGGLEPIGRFLSGFPTDSGMAFVVIQHLDPTSKSMLPELLSRQTKLKVQSASDGQWVSANNVYVIPPGSYLSISGGRLHCSPADSGMGARMPVDLFLRSLALDCHERGIGVILSGAGGDGAEGLKALKDAGGLTLAQDPNEAEHDSMPANAVATAHPDHVLKVQDMPAVLARYVAHHYVKASQSAVSIETPDASDKVTLAAVIDQLKSATGKDFRLYKTGTVQRRAERRMALHGIQTWADYVKLLRTSPAETDALAEDLLINVTGFFRDPRVFAALAKPVADLVRKHPEDKPVRLWVAGCSSGEEAYSLAIVLMEQIAAAGRRLTVQIFATDIDEAALATARAGAYPESISSDVSPERLKRFFTREDGRFQVVKGLRECVTFSRHDVLHDPPFSRLDMASCRNLLIYLVPEAQRHVLAMLHFALLDGGLLLLGSVEAADTETGLFEPVDDKLRIYRCRDGDRSPRVRFSMLESGRGLSRPGRAGRTEPPAPPSLSDVVQRMLQAYTPAAVVTNRQLVPIYYSGQVDRYLQMVPGEPNQDLLSIAREGLRPKLRDTIARAFRAKRRVGARGVWLSRGGKATAVTIEAERIFDEHEDLVLVTFIDELPRVGAGPRTAVGKAEDRSDTARLRQQLTETRQELNRTIHELRATNEELKAKNEEAMSLNEEFLTTNEELESSKEELQSLNEELTTVNNQLRQTLDQQQQTSTDLANLLDSSSVATILLDAKLRIKVFNPKMKALFSVIDTDIGRPLADLLPKFADPRLLADTGELLSTGVPSNREIRAESGAWYLRSALPYRSEVGNIEGAVVTFADVSQLKEAELVSESARRYAETIVDTVHEPLLVLDANIKVVSGNTAFCSEFDQPPDRIAGQALADLRHPILSDPRLQASIKQQIARSGGSDALEFELEQPGGGRRCWQANVRGFRTSTSAAPLILLTLRDVTDARHIGRLQLQLLIDAMPDAILAIDDQRRIQVVSKQMEALFGYRADELIGEPVDKLLPPEVRERHGVLYDGYLKAPKARIMGSGLDIHGTTKDGRRIPLDIGLSPVATADGLLIVVAIHDLRVLKEGEARLRQAKAAADRANQAKSRFLAAASHDLRQPLQIIRLLHGVLERKVADPALRTTVVRLDDAVSYMTELLDTLLDVHRIESGAFKAQLEEFRVTSVLTRAAADATQLAAAKGLKLSVVPSSAVVRSDPRLLMRIINNLLSNAVKYTESGKVLLGCRRRGNTLRIEVWDTGIGIPAESIEGVFEEFYQIDNVDAGKRGLGLGLYIVQRFAELLGHKVEIQSTPGKGTVFAIVISDPEFPLLARPGAARGVEAGCSEPTILLVEDDPAQLDTLRVLLELEGYRVVTAGRGDDALARLHAPEDLHPDIIIADYNLPGGMTGMEVIRRVRLVLNAETPAMIVSGGPLAESRQAIEDGGVRILPKPVKAADLVTAAAALMETAKPGWRPGDRPASPPAILPSASTPNADIAIIDDDPGVIEAVRVTLEADGYSVETFASAEAFLADPDHGRFRCLVVDLGLPGMDGIELQNQLKSEERTPPIIFVTGSGDLTGALRAMREGAADFLEKPVDSAALGDSVARVMRQSEQATSDQAERMDFARRLEALTKREREVMERIIAGRLNKNIATELGISQRTAEHHRQAVMQKMGVKSLAMLVRAVGMTGRH